MTTLLERPASGLTRSPRPAPPPPSLESGDDFLHRGTNGSVRHVVLDVAGVSRSARPRWVDLVEGELNQLLALPAGWDGRRALPVTTTAVEAVVALLSLVMEERTAAPQLFPLSDGGVQAEWHIDGNTVEVEIDGDGAAHVLADRSDGDSMAEGMLPLEPADATVAAVRRFLAEMSSRLLVLR